MEEYKSNSHKSKEQESRKVEEKRVEKVVKGSTRTKKKSELSKIKDTFISEDAANVKSYIIGDVLIPAAKKAISDIVSNGIDMILYGGKSPNRDRRGSSNYISYRDYSRRDDDRRYSSSNTSVINFVNEDPNKFNSFVEDKNIQVKCFVELCIARGELVRSELNQQISTPDGQFIGENMNAAVAYFNNPNNAAIKTQLENKMKLI